jgi:hypothetical protein
LPPEWPLLLPFPVLLFGFPARERGTSARGARIPAREGFKRVSFGIPLFCRGHWIQDVPEPASEILKLTPICSRRSVPGEGYQRGWPELVWMNEETRKIVDQLKKRG